MAYVYGYTELYKALQEVTGYHFSDELVKTAIHNAYLDNGNLGVQLFAEEHGIKYFVNEAGEAMWTRLGEFERVAGTTVPHVQYMAASESALDAGGTKIIQKELQQVTTQGATKTFTAGGVTTLAETLSIVGAVATGAKLGWESYKAHPDAWTDLSESIFNASKSPDTPLEVIARIHAGGYTTATKEENILKILQGLAKDGAFDYSAYESLIPTAGHNYGDVVNITDATWSSVGPIGKASGLAAAKAAELHPGCPIIKSVEMDRGGGLLQGYVTVHDGTLGDLPSSLSVRYTRDHSDDPLYWVSENTYGAWTVWANYDGATETVTYNESVGGSAIPSGRSSEGVGGLSVNVIEVEGDNELFPNPHDGTALSVAPNASISDIRQAFQDQFPEWYEDSWVQPEYNPETDTIENKRYYPVTIPWWDPYDNDKPEEYNPTDGDLYEEPDPKAKPQADKATEENDKTDTDTQDPEYPIVVPPDPSPPFVPDPTSEPATGLWSVYNPTVAELNDLGGYLWTNNVVELLEKFLQNPMDAIISLHRIYCTPETGSPQDIILGYLNSEVTAKVVTDQFVTVDCGSINVSEYFGDARDYDPPYTTVEAYLPFVGIVRLKTADIIGGKVNIVYTVDVYTGACLCRIYVTKLGSKQLLYNFSGNCSMQIPLTGSDRTRLLAGAVTGAVAGATSGAMVGGPWGAAAGAIAGGVGGAFKGGIDIGHTGGFSANAGCMGLKKPYLIITRKYSYDAGGYNSYYGYPINATVTLSSCKGFTKVRSLHIENILRATDDEKREIESLLKSGVIIK